MRIRQEPDMEELLNMSEHQLNRAISSLWPEVGVTLQVGGFVWGVASLPKVLGHAVHLTDVSTIGENNLAKRCWNAG